MCILYKTYNLMQPYIILKNSGFSGCVIYVVTGNSMQKVDINLVQKLYKIELESKKISRYQRITAILHGFKNHVILRARRNPQWVSQKLVPSTQKGGESMKSRLDGPKKFSWKVTTEPKRVQAGKFAGKSDRCGSGKCTKCK